MNSIIKKMPSHHHHFMLSIHVMNVFYSQIQIIGCSPLFLRNQTWPGFLFLLDISDIL